MYTDTFDMNGCPVGARRLDVSGGTMRLAGSTADTSVFVDDRNRTGVVLVIRHPIHGYRSNGTVTLTVTAIHPLGSGNANIRVNNCRTDFYGGFGGFVDRVERSCGTNLRAGIAFGRTIAFGVIKYRLHESLRIGRCSQHTVRAITDAKLASDAMLIEVRIADCSGRHDTRMAPDRLAGGDGCQGTVVKRM